MGPITDRNRPGSRFSVPRSRSRNVHRELLALLAFGLLSVACNGEPGLTAVEDERARGRNYDELVVRDVASAAALGESGVTLAVQLAGQPACDPPGPVQYALIVAHYVTAGYVTIESSCTDLTFTAHLFEPSGTLPAGHDYAFAQIDIDLQTVVPPVRKPPGQFAQQYSYASPSRSDFSQTIPFTAFGLPADVCAAGICNGTLAILFHLDIEETIADGSTLHQTGWSGDVEFTSGSWGYYIVFTPCCIGHADVVKTVLGAAPAAGQSFAFQLRKGASPTSAGTTLESALATSANGGSVAFASPLNANTPYQLCEIVMPGWKTSLGDFVPSSFIPPDGVAPNPNVDNSILCVDFTVTPGQTTTFTVDNTPPPGGRALAIGFWKNWASCAGSASAKGQQPVLDQTLAASEPIGIVVSATSGTFQAFGPTHYLVLHGSTATPDVALDCAKAVALLDKRTFGGNKASSNPAFTLAAQLVAAELNYVAGAGKTPAATSAINQAVLLLGKVGFTGTTLVKPSATDASMMSDLARTLDDYNNNR